jgi:hypothetical protein
MFYILIYTYMYIEEDIMQQAVKTSIVNRRGSINAVPFESALLYGQPKENIAQPANQKSAQTAVSKARRYAPITVLH